MKLKLAILMTLALLCGCGRPQSSQNAHAPPPVVAEPLLQPPPPNEQDISTFAFVVRIDNNGQITVAGHSGELLDLAKSLRSLGAKDDSRILIQSHASHRLYENAYSALTRAGFKQVAWNTYE